MPSIAVSKRYLLSLIGREVEDSVLEQTIFDFGVELDDIYEEDGEMMYKFDIAANRYDMLCAEGFATAIASYMFGEEFQDITVGAPNLVVTKEETHERSEIACAIIRDIEFTEDSYKSFISYQDKLHLSIGRNRSLSAFGTHDLDKLSGEIAYKSLDLTDIEFAPLNSSKIIKGFDLQSHFEKDKKISKYFDLWKNPKKANVFQCGSKIMSVAPITNSEYSKISRETKNVFVEVTGTDFNKVNTTLKLLLYNFRGSKIEAVYIKSKNETIVTPIMRNMQLPLSVDHINKKLNLNLSGEDVKKLLTKMMYKIDLENKTIHVPDIRSDVMHDCDIIEDIAIGYGFNNFVRKVPQICTTGSEDPLNKFTDKVRIEMALCGFNETLTLTLLSIEENFVDSDRQVVIANPKSKEFEVTRSSLLPGILKSVASNLHARIPIKLFESADVVLLSDRSEEGAENRRYFCAVLASNTPLLEDLQGPLSFILEKCGATDYRYEPVSDSRYLENQSASVIVSGIKVGTLGVLHPSVCCAFKIPYAASSFEIDLERVYSIINKI